jgi:hypothetical protein
MTVDLDSVLSSEDTLEYKLRAVRHAVGQQALEGLTVSEPTMKDLLRAAHGEITQDEVIRNIYARFSACPGIPIMTRTSTRRLAS